MANNSQLRGTPFSATAAGTAVALATLSKIGTNLYVTDINGSSNSTGTWALLCGTTGTTIFWQGSGTVAEYIGEAIEIPSAGTLTFTVNGSTVSYANMSGYYI